MKLPFNVDLSGKVAVVTGAGGVLMREFASALATCGAKVALIDINKSAVEEVASSIGENALPIVADCMSKQSLILAKEKVNAKGGKVNFLIKVLRFIAYESGFEILNRIELQDRRSGKTFR